MSQVDVSERQVEYKVKDYKGPTSPIWCPGCGDYGVLSALYQALADLNLPPEDVAVISGIGCSSRLPGYMATYGFNAVHGRILPIAAGVKMANPDITVIGTGGDGDGFSIGMGHVPHAVRRNMDITYIVMDNEIYGLTKGQLSPTAHVGDVTKTSVYGSIESPVEPVNFMLNIGASLVARVNAGNPKHMAEIIAEGIRHKGFAFINAMSPCRTFRGIEQKKYINSHAYYLEESEYTPTDKAKALELASNNEEIAMGILYREARPTYEGLYQDLRERAKSRGVPAIEEIIGRYIP